MNTPEDNIQDEHQHTREEWQEFESRQDKDSLSMQIRVQHELEHSMRQRDHYARFIGSEDPEMQNHSKAFYNKHDLRVACCRAYLDRFKKNTVPQTWICPECQFVYHGPKGHPGRCPNDEALMRAISREELAKSEKAFAKELLDLLDQAQATQTKLEQKVDAIDSERNQLLHFLHMTARIPRNGTEILVELISGRQATVKWDAVIGLWEETCGDMAYPDCDIARWAPLNWQYMPEQKAEL